MKRQTPTHILIFYFATWNTFFLWCAHDFELARRGNIFARVFSDVIARSLTRYDVIDHDSWESIISVWVWYPLFLLSSCAVSLSLILSRALRSGWGRVRDRERGYTTDDFNRCAVFGVWRAPCDVPSHIMMLFHSLSPNPFPKREGAPYPTCELP